MEDHEWYSLSDAKSVKKHKIKINGDIKPVKKHGTKETFVSLNLVEGCGSGRVESAGMQVGQGYGRGRGRGHQPNVVVKDGMQVVEKGFGRAYLVTLAIKRFRYFTRFYHHRKNNFIFEQNKVSNLHGINHCNNFISLHLISFTAK
ncbi:hypothetical protein QVD17_31807 [Tagetes erecta]|uniref:Uncharacterized protein n=1 Tax=Tagetes erecta TaxID=13708 RepID=A0AAD8K437_TARER|nr:hypothetical protein QVD17_31807 [Tagetes erecta]